MPTTLPDESQDMKLFSVFHPFVFSLFAILHVCWSDPPFHSTGGILLGSVAVVSFTALLLVGLSAFFKNDLKRAAICTSFIICMLFSYWAVHRIMSDLVLGNQTLIPHYYFLPVWSAGFVLGSIFLASISHGIDRINRMLCTMSVVLVALCAVSKAADWAHIVVEMKTIRADQQLGGQRDYSKPITANTFPGRTTMPNIYYIIPDGYARADILRNYYDYDNGPWLAELAKRGFYVASASRTNYSQTKLSLGSSLNMRYLQDLGPKLSKDLLFQTLQNNKVSEFLKSLGYETIAISSGYPWTELTKSDFYSVAPSSMRELVQNKFTAMTPLMILQNRISSETRKKLHREWVRYSFDRLADIATEKGPCFIFCHIIAPHPPFLFDEAGEDYNSGETYLLADGNHYHAMDESSQGRYRINYVKQIRFVNMKMLKTIDGILAHSDEPPIIIIQSDHGPGSKLDWNNPSAEAYKERMSNFCAILVPAELRKSLYPEITPVNIFRLIFKHRFGADLEILPDQTYFSNYDHSFDWTDVTEITQ
jgi:hypothetical protein